MESFAAQLESAAIPAGPITLFGDLHVPLQASGVVLFAHGSGSSRLTPRNQRVAEFLHEMGLGTLLFDLFLPEEEAEAGYNAHLRFDVELLASRLRAATDWVRQQDETAHLPLGYFGASTGAAAALEAARAEGGGIAAVVTRGGRVDLLPAGVRGVKAPTLLIVGDNDAMLKGPTLETWAALPGVKAIEIIPGAGHLFEEPGALDNVAALAGRWFSVHLRHDGSGR